MPCWEQGEARSWTIYFFQENKIHSAYRHTSFAFRLHPRGKEEAVLIRTDFRSTDRTASLHKYIPLRRPAKEARRPSFSIISDEKAFRKTVSFLEEVGSLRMPVADLIALLDREYQPDYSLIDHNCRDHSDAIWKKLSPHLTSPLHKYSEKMEPLRQQDRTVLAMSLGLIVLALFVIGWIVLARKR